MHVLGLLCAFVFRDRPEFLCAMYVYMLIGMFHCSRVCMYWGCVLSGCGSVSSQFWCMLLGVKFRRCERYTAVVFLPLSLLNCGLVYTRGLLQQ